jgi:hypothetical protein
LAERELPPKQFFKLNNKTMILQQTITLSDIDESHGYVTIEREKEALFWLYALCERTAAENLCKKTVLVSPEKGDEYLFRRSEIKDLHTRIDRCFRDNAATRFPSLDMMNRFANRVVRSKDSEGLSGEIGDILSFLAPLKTVIEYIDSSKVLKIKFTEKEGE